MSLAPPDVRAAKATLAAHRKATRKARPKSPKVDRGRVRDPGFLQFVRRQPCAIAGRRGHICAGPVEAAHVRFATPDQGPAGMQRKPSDLRAVPLCRGGHRTGPGAQHSMNERRFWEQYDVDPLKLAAVLYVQYLKGEQS